MDVLFKLDMGCFVFSQHLVFLFNTVLFLVLNAAVDEVKSEPAAALSYQYEYWHNGALHSFMLLCLDRLSSLPSPSPLHY